MPDHQPLTAAELDELERLEKEASPGEWRSGRHETDRVFIPYPGGLAGPGGERVLLRMNNNRADWPWVADARLIAAARNALPRLIAAAREMAWMSKRIHELESENDHLNSLALEHDDTYGRG